MRKKAHIAIREGEKIRNVYVMPEEKEEIKTIKKEQGLRSLKEAYEVWKQAKQTLESRSEDPVPTFSPEDPDADIKRDELIYNLQQTIKNQRIEIATLEATINALHKQMDSRRQRRGRRTRNNDGNQHKINEAWPLVSEETH